MMKRTVKIPEQDYNESKYCQPIRQCCSSGQPLLQEERDAELDPMTWCNDDGNWRYGERGLFG